MKEQWRRQGEIQRFKGGLVQCSEEHNSNNQKRKETKESGQSNEDIFRRNVDQR